ncbi:MAG: hypothetical protein ACRC7G_08095 [Beijerinckiaceae bacterium]
MTVNYSLDTRRDGLPVLIDLGREAGAMIDLVAFDAPDDLRAAAKLEIVTRGAMLPGRDMGWRAGDALKADILLEPGKRATLAVSREWLAARVALARVEGAGAGAATVALPFATILHLPRGPKASSPRAARISVVAGASRPGFALRSHDIDLDALPPGVADRLAEVTLELPDDLAFEAHRALTLDLACAGQPAEALLLVAPPGLAGVATIERIGDAPGGGARFRVTFPIADEAAGRQLALGLMLKRDALLSSLDRLLAREGGQPRLVVSGRISGWGEAQSGDGERRFAFAAAPSSTRLISSLASQALIAVGDSAIPCVIDGDTPCETRCAEVTIACDPEVMAEPVRAAGLPVAALRWPLGRLDPITIRAEARIGDTVIHENAAIISPNLERGGDATRQARTLLPLRALVDALSERVRLGGTKMEPITLIITAETGGRVFLRTSAPVVLSRQVHRQPICIDLGASAISIWAGSPAPDGASFDLRPLPLGQWLAEHVDAGHAEAMTREDGQTLLIPSHVSLDSGNHLRAARLPSSLPELSMLGADREAARRRMAHFGRRYDVSVPAPPAAPGRPASRRVAGLKHALATGQLALSLPDPVNRLDPVTGRVGVVSLVETPQLVADVLDELIDLYVLRLAQGEVRADAEDPAPVAPRIVVTCPSGVGDAIRNRYATALSLFHRRLDRLFPGASALPDAVSALPEAIAAARYISEALARDIDQTHDRPHLLLTLDIGASTSDVALARLTVRGGRLTRFEPLSTFGLPVGGALIDQALTEIVVRFADGFLALQGERFRPAFAAADLARALGSDESGDLAAQHHLAGAILKAKSALSDQLRAADGPYDWQPGTTETTLDITLFEIGADNEHRGVMLPSTSLLPGVVHVLAPGVVVREEANRLILSLDAAAVEKADKAERRLANATEALGVLLQRMGRAAVPAGAVRPVVHVVATGRGALWPPLHAAMAAEAAAGRDNFPFARPLPAASMKKAVAGGAALLLAEPGGLSAAPLHAAPLAIAVAGVHLTERWDGALSSGQVTERVIYLDYGIAGGGRRFEAGDTAHPSLTNRANLGQRFDFVRAAPGLDPQGVILGKLRALLGHREPVARLEGDASVDAAAERVERFGACEILCEDQGGGIRRVVIRSQECDFEGAWRIDGDRVSRIY